jgi:hypothetical protein
MQQLAEQLVRYDLDDLDVCWLEEVNFTRRELGGHSHLLTNALGVLNHQFQAFRTIGNVSGLPIMFE